MSHEVVEARFTRLSLGTQIRQELEQLERAGRISGWTFDAGDDVRGIRYRVVQPSGEVFVMSPGELADWLNGRHGCDVRYKNPLERLSSSTTTEG